MNVNYVRMDRLPSYGSLLEAVAKGDYFITTGEVLLPKIGISTTSPEEIAVKAEIRWMFPLRMAEVVWGDGSEMHRETFPLETTPEFGSVSFDRKVRARNWTWARFAVWDVAGNAALVNPVGGRRLADSLHLELTLVIGSRLSDALPHCLQFTGSQPAG